MDLIVKCYQFFFPDVLFWTFSTASIWFILKNHHQLKTHTHTHTLSFKNAM